MRLTACFVEAEVTEERLTRLEGEVIGGHALTGGAGYGLGHVEPAVGHLTQGGGRNLGVDEHRLPQLSSGGEEFVVDQVVEERVTTAAVDHRSNVA